MRIILSGLGIPFPEFASDAPVDDEFHGLQVIFEDGAGVFTPADYIADDYVTYEVWCIGGAGGHGGGGTTQDGYWGDEDKFAWPYYDSDGVRHTHHPFIPDRRLFGGGGGGGGLHVVSGDLADLPESVPLFAGAAGDDAPIGQIKQDTAYTPTLDWIVYDEPHISFSPPADGEDGDASTFGEGPAIAQASGGEGGAPCLAWVSGTAYIQGGGGRGGRGDRTAVGGGAAGALATGEVGHVGAWDGDIGEGGGGGLGGVVLVPLPPDPSNPTAPGHWLPWTGANPEPYRNHLAYRAATKGGDGSYEYGDTGKSSRGGDPISAPASYRIIHPSHDTFDPLNPSHPLPSWIATRTLDPPDSRAAMPGAGGGVRLDRDTSYGSKAQGAKAKGAVIVRMRK